MALSSITLEKPAMDTHGGSTSEAENGEFTTSSEDVDDEGADYLTGDSDDSASSSSGDQESAIGDLDDLDAPDDINHAIRSSKLRPATLARTVDQFYGQVSKHPQAPAVQSWDGDLTYQQLEEHARRLAVKLQDAGVEPEAVVALFFPKSVWTVVSMMAVQMAGGAFVALDPEVAPLRRLRAILDDTKAKILLTSQSNFPELAEAVTTHTVLCVDQQSIDELAKPDQHRECAATPQNLSYIFYTIDATNQPKGVFIEHQAVCSSADAYGADLGIGPGTRVFQFSSYASHIGILDVLVTLMRGGCVCIPSEEERIHRMEASISRTAANWAFLTPTVANSIIPDRIPTLKVVCLGDEAISQRLVDKWKNTCDVHALYGSAESSVCAWNPSLGKSDSRPSSLGHPLASAFWVLDHDDKPALLGWVGELVVEGPLLARGYLNTAMDPMGSFSEGASWLPGDSHGMVRRAYRTGDLVRRNEDGTFDFVGKKTSQRKIKGQQVELQQIESCLLDCLPDDMSGAVVATADSILAFAWSPFANAELQIAPNIPQDMPHFASDIHNAMSRRLPRYMVPQAFYLCHGRPQQTLAGKMNRRQVERLGKKSQESSDFWLAQLSGFRPLSFPPKSDHLSHASIHHHKTVVQINGTMDHNMTKSCAVQAAWAFVLARYCNTDDVCYAVATPGDGGGSSDGVSRPRIGTAPMRLQINRQPDQTCLAFMRNVQRQAENLAQHEHFGSGNISRLSPEANTACDVSSLLVVQSTSQDSESEKDTHIAALSQEKMPAVGESYPLVISANIHNNSVALDLAYHANVIESDRVEMLSHHLQHVLEQLSKSADMPLTELTVSGQADYALASRYNQLDPVRPEQSLPNLVRERAIGCPDAEAIWSRDWVLSYRELEDAATRLSCHLKQLNVTRGSYVPICHEKSPWIVIAMLAIQKTGAAFVPMDPNHPRSRREHLVKELGSDCMIVSPSTAVSCRGLVKQVVEVGSELLSAILDYPSTDVDTPSHAEDVAAVYFTSGSTGEPKGILLEHHSLVKSIMVQKEQLGLNSTTRFLQFTNMAFDVTMLEIYGSLMFGGTVCIPNEAERLQDLASFINDSKCDIAFATPSLARKMSPKLTPGLRTLLLGGEAPTRQDVKLWHNSVALFNLYGPAEASIWTSLHQYSSEDEDPLTLGKPIISPQWIVEPDDHNKLAPVGCVGELAIEGSVLARGYLNQPEKTAKVFVSTVGSVLGSHHEQRFYLTGDLVKQHPNGSITYVGRKDTQVKIRGQRLETGEVESHLSRLLDSLDEVVVDAIEISGHQKLVAFVHFRSSDTVDDDVEFGGDSCFLTTAEYDSVRESLGQVSNQLKDILPAFMVPDTILPLKILPHMSISTKLDRKALKSWAEGLSQETLNDYAVSSQHYVEPADAVEYELREIWANELDLKATTIGRDDAFLAIGGDSISAIRVAEAARKQNILITVADIFADSRLCTLARQSTSNKVTKGPEHIERFQLMQGLLPQSVDEWAAQARQQGILTGAESIEDAYPCIPLVEGLMALSATQPGSYIMKAVYKLSPDIDLSQFKAAWAQTLDLCTTLRTRIVVVDGQAVQVLVKGPPAWEEVDGMDIHSYMEKHIKPMQMGYGTSLNRYALIPDQKNQGHFLVWAVHHAIYDGWTLNLAISTLHQAYRETQLTSLPSYSGFIQYITGMDMDAAASYWRKQLDGARLASFPPSTSHVADDSSRDATRIMTHRMDYPSTEYQGKPSSITRATVLRATWAIVLARYCDTDDITFGTTISGRNAPVLGASEMPGPMVATVPVRISVDKSQPVEEYLQAVQDQASGMIPFQQMGLSRIAKISSDAKAATDFTSLLVIQPKPEADSADSGILRPASGQGGIQVQDLLQNYFSYPLVVQCYLSDDHVDLGLTYDADLLPEARLEALSHHFETVMQQLRKRSAGQRLKQIGISGEWDVARVVQEYNPAPPEVADVCIHELIQQQAESHPESIAISAWDGSLTYSQLDEASSRLGNLLVSEYDVAPSQFVHVCFDKSLWFFVAILAINKCGAAWVPLDPSHPKERLQQISAKAGCKLALVSQQYEKLCGELLPSVLAVGHELDERLKHQIKTGEHSFRRISPDNPVYALFTSGSTGQPKGFVMSHRAVATSQRAIGLRLGMGRHVRMLQFASFVFDLSIGEIIGPLIHGACLCVPSEDMRMNGITDFIRDAQVNWAYLTPAFARAVHPSDTPSLELLLLAGEAVSKSVLDHWLGRVPRLVNGWGPAETCCFSSLHEWDSNVAGQSPLTVGRPVGGFCWIVDPEDPTSLAPVGTVGEVLVHGPTLLNEYLGDRKLTEASIVSAESLKWLPNTAKTGSWSRLYKSGDLAYYNAEGMIEFSSRKDTQIKIRGIRVEPGDIEHQIRQCLPDVQQVAVDAIYKGTSASLVAFICLDDASHRYDMGTDLFEPLTGHLRDQVMTCIAQLNVKLPRYMVPAMFIPLKYMPVITSTKLDRKTLRQLSKELDQESVEMYSCQQGQKREPETAKEFKMRDIWSALLNLPTRSIGRDDSFLHLGGDSIAVINLCSKARDQGITLFVKDVMRDPRLSAVAAIAVDNIVPDAEIAPLSLLPGSLQRKIVDDHIIQRLCSLGSGETLQDAYPCSALQEGLMSLTAQQPRSYINKYIFKLGSNIDPSRFRSAWNTAVQLCENLTTRIVKVDDECLQARFPEDTSWEKTEGHDLESYLKQLETTEMTYGSRLCRFALIEDGADKTASTWFCWTIHHAINDGFSLRLVHKTLHAAYWGLELPSLEPYNRYIKYILDMDKTSTADFWREQLDGAHAAAFPRSSSMQSKRNSKAHSHTVQMDMGKNRTGATKATLVRAAWAMVLARYSDSQDITFGVTSSGRDATVPGIDSMAGPAIATVPFRTRLNEAVRVDDLLQQVQSRANEMTDHEHYGLQNIAKISPDAKQACEFSSLLVVQPSDHIFYTDGSADGGLFAAAEPNTVHPNASGRLTRDYFSYPLVLQAGMLEGLVELGFYYDANVIGDQQMQALGHYMDHVIQQLLHAEEGSALDSVRLVGPWDEQQAMEHTAVIPESTECIHERIRKQAKTQPDAPAISSWDGELTYGQLEGYASRLAVTLKEYGIGAESIVPMCFPKSAWANVAMVAIMMAGGAFAPLDPSAPRSRLEGIVADTKATLILTAPSCRDKVEGLCGDTLDVDSAMLTELCSTPAGDTSSSSVKPAHAASPAVIVFTSGSTGKPKGIILEHHSICTFSDYYGPAHDIAPGSRVFNFSAYTFDIGAEEVLVTLMRGGCVCTPSEDERLSDLAGAISRSRATMVFLTPTVAELLRPADVSGLDRVCLGGEAITAKLVDAWSGQVKLSGIYGPAETAVCALNMDLGRLGGPKCLGWPMASALWAVEPNNPEQLVPVGCVGELLVQGPMLARGYLNASKEAESNWMTDVKGLPDARFSRAYRSGDLVVRNADGTFDFVGRKDTQVKIHGQRVELGEIETQVQKGLPETMTGIVAVVQHEASQQGTLTALLWYTTVDQGGKQGARVVENVTKEMQELISKLDSSLSLVLPRYMTPTSYLIYEGQPEQTTSGKIDRRQLIRLASEVDATLKRQFDPESSPSNPPTTALECTFRDLWAELLGIDAASIQKNDNFLKVGGDSITAMRLVTMAASHGIHLTVNDIFRDPRLFAVAQAADTEMGSFNTDPEPFHLLPQARLDEIKSAIHNKCNLTDKHTIEDAYPCTALQVGYLTNTVNTPGASVSKRVFKLGRSVDIPRFQTSWEMVVHAYDNLRKRIISFEGSSIQATIDGDVNWGSVEGRDVSTFLDHIDQTEFGYDYPLSRYAVVMDGDGNNYFVLVMHHAAYDGVSLGHIMTTLAESYSSMAPPARPSVPYSRFIAWMVSQDREDAREYWKKTLAGSHRPVFPQKPETQVGERRKDVTRTMQETLDLPPSKHDGTITIATILRTALALVLAHHNNGANDVCFSQTLSGRQAPVEGLDQIVGPTIARVPARVSLNRAEPVAALLERVQKDAAEATTHEHFGYANIRGLSKDAAKACDATTLLIVQPMEFLGGGMGNELLEPAGQDVYSLQRAVDAFYSFPLVIQAMVATEGRIYLIAVYDRTVLSSDQVSTILNQLSFVVKKLSTSRETLLGGVIIPAGNAAEESV